MPTKTLKFDDDVLQIIGAMEWQDGGKLGVLTCGQLDRRLYLRVNKALEAMGGKWSRKKGGHVFPTDPLLQLGVLVENGALTVERDGFFETPPEIVELMVGLVNLTGKVLEPSAGLGAIADNLPVPKSRIFCIEKNEQRAMVLSKKGYHTLCCDFLEFHTSAKFDTVIMNPPFEEGQDIAHVRHAYSCLAPEGSMVSVMSEGSFFRDDKTATTFRDWLERVGGESHKLPPQSFKKSGTGVYTRLIVIHKNGAVEEVARQGTYQIQLPMFADTAVS